MRRKLLVLFLLLSVVSQAQLIVNNTVRTPASLVQDVLIGAGVTPFNIKFNRSAAQALAVRDQAAEFSTNFTPTNLGLNAGILLTTGKATVANGPNDAGGKADETATITQGDADLALLSGQAINNVALLEFDFVATGLVLNFDYVFASEEYPEWTSSAYNDTFGFFLSGMGLSGPYSNGAINIALIPTTTTASNVVSIGNVNNGVANGGPCRNCAYYVSNGTGGTPAANQWVQYDGFTRPLRATAPLVCGETYHIKLAIANAGPGNDNLFDSGVFIKNFRIEPLQLSVSGGLFGNTINLCYGTAATINSGVAPSANTIKWYKDGVLIASETTPNLPITQAGVYTFEEYTPSGCRLNVDDITITYSPEIPVTPPLDLNLCTSASGPYTFNIDQTARITATINPTDYIITYYDTNAGGEATYGLPTGIIPDANLAAYSIAGTTATIYVRIEDVGTGSGCVSVKSFNLNVIPAPSGTFSYNASPYCNNQLAAQPVTTTALTPGGIYSATPAGLIIDPNTGAITPFGSAVNTYMVKYEIPTTGGCPYYSTTAPVTIDNCTCTVTASSSTQSVCLGTPVTPVTYTSSTGATTGSVPVADLPPGVTGSFSGGTFTVSGTPTAVGTYTYTVTLETGITDTCTATTTIEVKPIPTATISGNTTICPGDTAFITLTGTPGATVSYLINNAGIVQTVALNAAGTATFTTLPLSSTTTFDLVRADTGGTPNCGQTLTGSVTVNVKPLPTATISGTTTICSGTGTTISFTGTPGAIITYNINAGANQTITLDATGNAGITTGVLTGDATYNLINVATGGTPNCSQVLTGSATVTVKPLPTATLSGGTTICSGTSTNLTIVGTPGATVTYKIGTGANQTTILDATGNAILNTGNLTTAVTYYLLGISSNGTPNCSQTLTDSATVNVTSLPTVSISGTTTICSGDTATITFTGTANATVTYQINSSGPNQSITLDGTGSGSFTTLPLTSTTTIDLVDVSIGAGCSQTQSGSVTITVKSIPVASISGSTTICAGTGTTISFTGTPGAIVTYNIGGGTSQTTTLDATGNAGIATGNLTSDTTYNILKVETAGTPNCSQTLTGSVLVSVIQIPTASISGTATICSGDTTTISFTGTPGATVTYLINNTGTAQTITLDATGGASFLTAALTSTTTYDLVRVDTVGTPSCGQTLTGSVTVTVSSLPVATISGATTICSGDTATITFTGTPNATVSYLINSSGVAQTVTLDATGAGSSTTLPLTSTTTYDLQSAAIGGTTGCSQPQSGSVTVTVNPLPVASISGATTICSGDSTTVSITGTPNAIVTYNIGTAPIATTTLDATGNAVLITGPLTSDTTYNILKVETGGTPNCSQTLTGSVLISVKALPLGSISGATTICSGDTTTISFTGTPNATVTYLINGSGASQTITLDGSGNGSFVTTALTGTTTYDLVRVDTGGAPNCGQTITGSVTVTVNALPIATLSGSTTICSGDTAPITFTGTPGATVTYLINNSGMPQTIALGATGSAILTTSALTSNTSYDLVRVESGGVPNCIQPLTGSVLVSVNSLPTASVLGDTICSGSAATVTFTGTPGATVTYLINGSGSGQTIVLDASGTALLPTSILTSDTTYDLQSVSVTGVSNCSQNITGSALVRVLPLPTATISGTTQLCLNSPSPQITFTGAGGQSPYIFTYSINAGFSQTISTASGSDSVTLPVSTTAAGQFVYDLISVSSSTTPSCGQGQLGSATVTVLRLPTATITGSTQVCINDTMPQITFTGVNGQAPYTFNYKVNNGPVQTAISLAGNSSATVNVPTTSAGSFVYELVSVSSATTPSCSQNQSGTATVVVRPGSDLTTTSLTTQTVCVNTAIAPIVLNLGGSATGVLALGLPSGVTGVLNAAGTVYTISGAPSSVGSANYTITTTGGCLPAAVISGTITASPNVTLSLTTPGANAQTLCINTNIAQIQYSVGNGATGATTTGTLPNGVNAIFSAGVLSISGTALQAGTFNYTVTTVGGCSSASLSGVLIVKPEVELILASAPITTLQSVCIGVPITPIRYNVNNGATGANVTGLPTGITGSYAGGVFTISGSSSVVGTHNFVVTTIGGCGSDTQNGSITVNPNVSIALTSPGNTTSQAICINEAIDPIVYTVGSGATGASLIAGQVPEGIQGSFNQLTKEFTISGIAIEAGNFNYTISTTGGCGTATLTGTMLVSPLPVIDLPQDGFICVDVAGNPTTQYTLRTNLQPSLYTFEWSDVNGVISGEIGNSYTASAPGLYTVKVTNVYSGCFDLQSATIVPSLPPAQVVANATSYFEQDQMVTLSVSPPGNYLYQLDNGLFQENPFFTNLPSGYHTVTVKDRFGCGTASTSFRIVNFPRFFTPNNDGYNDTWNITEIAADQPNAYIYIFDRYGKFLKEISVQGAGWDGTLNGVELPSSDYWFRVFYKENGEDKEYKSHFSLKR